MGLPSPLHEEFIIPPAFVQIDLNCRISV